MKEEELTRLFGEANQKQPDPNKKRAAIEAAKKEFSQHSTSSTQGFEDSHRPISNIMSLSRREKMSQISQRWIYSGMASAAVMVLAVSIVFSGSWVPKLMAPGDDADGIGEFRPESSSTTYNNEVSDNRGKVLEEIVVTGAPLLAKTQKGVRETELRPPAQASSKLVPQSAIQERMEADMNTAAGQYAAASKREATARRSLGDRQTIELTPRAPEESYRNQFQVFETSPVKSTATEPVSTFSIDVDTASYSFIRKQLNQGVLPAKSAVRLEEMVNYFPYEYPTPNNLDAPFLPTITVMPSPWNTNNKLIHIGIKGYEMPKTKSVRSNLVFLLDVSGSMNQPDKLPLVKQSMSMLLSQLHPEDTVAIVVYAGAAGTILEPTPVAQKQKILSAMNRLRAGGSTAGAAGIKLAYQLAEANFVEEGVNRVFLATDGDFNVGMTNHDELQGFVERKRDSGIYLSILGFGQGNYSDALMQQLAQNGNGIAAYIDTLGEAQKVLVEEAQSQLFPIANDVKIQVEFNPKAVSEYRLLGYETRSLRQEDFNNDKVDAGEIGAGHSVTAIYEITPRGNKGLLGESRYQSAPADARLTQDQATGEYGFLNIRYKNPGEKVSKLISQPIAMAVAAGSEDARFAVAVAGFAQLLKDGQYTGQWNLEDALQMALENKGFDAYGYRAEFTQLIRKAQAAEAIR